MTLTKSLLLGSAAAFFTVAVAQGADLPNKKGAPAADYVRACKAVTPSGPIVGFTLPGSDTCLKLSGEVDAFYIGAAPSSRSSDALGFHGRGFVDFQLVNNTPAGPLVADFRFNGDNNVSGLVSSPPSGVGLDHAWISVAGITAGARGSFFDGYMSGALDSNNDIISTDVGKWVLAYTALLGGGVNSTLSIEGPINGGVNGGTALGARAPDVVAAMDTSGAWGSAHIAAVAHEVVAAPNAPATISNADTVGFGAIAALSVNLPTANKSWFDIQGAYTNGAIAYSGLTSPGIGANIPVDATPQFADIVATKDGWSRSSAMTLAMGLHYGLTSKLSVGPVLSYGAVSYSNGGLPTVNMLVGGGTLTYAPVNNLSFGLDLLYVEGRSGSDAGAATPTPSANFGGFISTIKVSRAF